MSFVLASRTRKNDPQTETPQWCAVRRCALRTDTSQGGGERTTIPAPPGAPCPSFGGKPNVQLARRRESECAWLFENKIREHDVSTRPLVVTGLDPARSPPVHTIRPE
jgi:hypothetical protein